MENTKVMGMLEKTLEKHSGLYIEYELKNDHVVNITFPGDNLDTIDISVIFTIGEDDDDQFILASINCFELPNFADKYAEGLVMCNKANEDGLVSYYIDEDNDAVVQHALLFNALTIESDFCPEEVLTWALKMAMDVDEIYPEFAKAKYA